MCKSCFLQTVHTASVRFKTIQDWVPFPLVLLSLQKWHEDLSAHRDEVEEVGSRAQEILEESHASSRMGSQATQLTSRYQALLLQVLVSCPLPWHLQETADILSLSSLHQLLLKMSDGPQRPWPWGFHLWFSLLFAFTGANKILRRRNPESGGNRIIAQLLFRLVCLHSEKLQECGYQDRQSRWSNDGEEVEDIGGRQTSFWLQPPSSPHDPLPWWVDLKACIYPWLQAAMVLNSSF